MLKEHAAAASNLASKRKAVACCDVLLCRTEHATTASKLVESKEAAVCAVKSTHDDCLDRKHAERKEGGRRRVAEHAAPTDVSARRRPRGGDSSRVKSHRCRSGQRSIASAAPEGRIAGMRRSPPV